MKKGYSKQRVAICHKLAGNCHPPPANSSTAAPSLWLSILNPCRPLAALTSKWLSHPFFLSRSPLPLSLTDSSHPCWWRFTPSAWPLCPEFSHLYPCQSTTNREIILKPLPGVALGSET